jgi:hypothetical protein
MGHRIIVSPGAQQEIEVAIEFYSSKTIYAPKHFIYFLEYAKKSFKISPFFKI